MYTKCIRSVHKQIQKNSIQSIGESCMYVTLLPTSTLKFPRFSQGSICHLATSIRDKKQIPEGLQASNPSGTYFDS